MALWRGSLLPLGREAALSVPLKQNVRLIGFWPLGLLRSPAGASSLATKEPSRSRLPRYFSQSALATCKPCSPL